VTKSGLIEALAGLASLTQKEAETVVDTVFDRIAEALAKGDKVRAPGIWELPRPAPAAEGRTEPEEADDSRGPRQGSPVLQGREGTRRGGQ